MQIMHSVHVLSPARLCSWGENGDSLYGEMACVESPPFRCSDYTLSCNDGMLLARVPEIAFVVLMLGKNSAANHHPMGVCFWSLDCLSEDRLQAIVRPSPGVQLPYTAVACTISVPSTLRSWALGRTKSSERMPNNPAGLVP